MIALAFGALAVAGVAGFAALRTALLGAPAGVLDASLGLGGSFDPGLGWLFVGAVVGGAAGYGDALGARLRRPSARRVLAIGAAFAAVGHVAALTAAAAAHVGADPVDVARRLGAGAGAAWTTADLLATALAAVTGGIAARSVAALEHARRVTRRLPDWVLPSSRILMHLARADHQVRNEETELILELLSRRLPPDAADLRLEHGDALWRVLRGESRVLAAGRRLHSDLRHPCFDATARREATAKLAIRLIRRDGTVHEDEREALDEICAAWSISGARRAALEAEVEAELAHALPIRPDVTAPAEPDGPGAGAADPDADPRASAADRSGA